MTSKLLLIGGLLGLMTSWSSAQVFPTCESLTVSLVTRNHSLGDLTPEFELQRPDVFNVSVVLRELEIEFEKVDESAILCAVEGGAPFEVDITVPIQEVRFSSPNMTLSGFLYNTTVVGDGPAKFIAKNLVLTIRGVASAFNFGDSQAPEISFTKVRVNLVLEGWKAAVEGIMTDSEDDVNELLSQAGPDVFSELARILNRSDEVGTLLNGIFPQAMR